VTRDELTWRWTDFVSRRVGNYQYNPQWRALLGQMWVK
jgi:hypothetical protein